MCNDNVYLSFSVLTRRLVALLAFVVLLAACPAYAQTVTFFFANPGSTTPITNVVTTGTNQVINLSVYYQSTFAANTADVFIGYDNTTITGSGATRLDNKIVLNGDASSAVSNFSSSPFPTFLGGQEGGGQGNSGVTRPFGDDLAFFTADGSSYTPPTGNSPIHLFDISLLNQALTSGSEQVTIYSFSSGTEDTTYLTPDDTTYARPTTYTLTVTAATAAPEPSAVVSLMIGISLLAFKLWQARSCLRRLSDHKS